MAKASKKIKGTKSRVSRKAAPKVQLRLKTKSRAAAPKSRRSVARKAPALKVIYGENVRATKRRGFSETDDKWFDFVDLFAGIGGMRLAFDSIGGRCVATAEWNKYARTTYEENFRDKNPPGHVFIGDIQPVQPADIPRHDVLVAGFPCQPFSIAGVSKKNALGRPHGFDCHEQGNLFFKIRDILAHHRPAAFLLENVKNLERHDKGRTFAVIRDTLENKLKYRIRHIVLDAQHWVPQHRERVFIIGFREEAGFDPGKIQIPPKETKRALRDILLPERDVPEKYTLTQHLWGYLQNYAKKHAAKGNGFGFGLVGPNDITRTLSARYFKDGSEILVRQTRTEQPRRLMPKECARLMGFEYGAREWKIPVSDTQAYKQFGNAVVVPVVQAVAQSMEQHIRKLVIGSDQVKLPIAAAG